MEILQTDWISKWAQYSPERIALKDYESQQCLTYAQLNHKAERLAVYLQNDLAIKKGDRIAVLAEHSIDYITLFVAAQKTGIILLPLNYRLTSSELDYMLQDGAPALLCFDQKFEALVNACTEIKGLSNIWRLNELVEAKSAAGNNLKPISIQEKDPIFILYTSGTTGNPKGAIYTHGMLFWNSINTSMSLLINSESRTINVMPPFHTGGWNVLITPLLHHGGFICLLKKFEAKTVLDLLESEKPTLFMAVPTMLAMLREETTFAKADLSSLFYFIVGGESMPIALIEAWHQKGIAIRQG
ncbi:MAG: AMP-binding protein, partial [Bacteroidota bacterium]